MKPDESEEEKIKLKIEKKLAALDKIIGQPKDTNLAIVTALDVFNSSVEAHTSVAIMYNGGVHIIRCIDPWPHYRWSIITSFLHEFDSENKTYTRRALKHALAHRGGFLTTVEKNKQVTICFTPKRVLTITK